MDNEGITYYRKGSYRKCPICKQRWFCRLDSDRAVCPTCRSESYPEDDIDDARGGK